MTDLSLPNTLSVENARHEVHSRNEFKAFEVLAASSNKPNAFINKRCLGLLDETFSPINSKRYRYQPLRLYRNWQVRRLVRNMLDMEDVMLDDVGIERHEVQWAARLPLTVNASIAMHERARRRRSLAR